MGDLPDYYQYVTPVTVEIPTGEEPQTDVAEYDSTPEDLVDGSRGPLLVDVKGRLYVRLHQIDAEDGSLPVIPRPKGGVLEKDSATTTASYATVVSRVVTDAKQFQLSKIVVSAEKATWVKYRWDDTDISCERLLDDKTILIEHFPWDYYDMEGDGAKAFDVQAKYDTAAGTVNVEIVGEEVV